MPAAVFGIENDALNLSVNLLILFLVVLYLALIAWTYFDARRRIEDSFLVACATASALFPFVGPVIYSILRPPEFIEDKRERELEIRAAELRVKQLEEGSCPNCEHPVERNFLRCPNCRARIKDPCESCGKPIDPRWSICPYCETPTRRAAAAPERRPARRRAKAPSERTASERAAGSKPPPRKAPAARQAAPRDGSRTGGSRTAGPSPTRSPSSAEPRPAPQKPRKPAPRAAADE